MLEKDKDYIEMRVRNTGCCFTKNTANMSIDGYTEGPYWFLPDPGKPYVVILKEKFEQLQAENEQLKKLKKKLEEYAPVPENQVSANGWEESAKFWKKRYDDLLKLVGFSSKEEVEDYLVNEAECDTLHEAMLKLIKENNYACEEWCKANSSNNSWKAAAECNSPKELMEKIEGFEKEIIDLKTKNTEYACRIQNLIDDSYGRKTVIEAYKRDIERWKKATGCLRPENISTESLISKCTVLEQEAKIYSKALQDWKEVTGCPSPSAAKTLIESGMSYEHGFHEVQEENRKLIDDINSWKNVTGYSIPEEFLSAMINNKPQSLYSWQKATGCKTPEEAKSAIRYYKARLGNAVQSASIATKILGNAVQSEANAMEILDTIGYKDPIKED